MDHQKGLKLLKSKGLRKQKSSKKRRISNSSDDESIDLSEKLFPIAHYINDKNEMIEQVFSVMEKEKLNCMLPPILKGMTLTALKEHCLRELCNMSNDEIKRVLCGEPLDIPQAQNSTGVLSVDSDSEESIACVEECHSPDQEKKTLLDILEQEMQEIALNTVFRKDQRIASPTSEEELPEIVAIIPTKSPTTNKCDVPLICIDSGDEDASDSKQKSTSVAGNVENISGSIVGECDQSSSRLKESSMDKNPVSKNAHLHTEVATKSPESSHHINCTSNIPLAKPMLAKENFLIQVFPSASSSSERVVKKVSSQFLDSKNVDEAMPENMSKSSVEHRVGLDLQGEHVKDLTQTNHNIQKDEETQHCEEKLTLAGLHQAGTCDPKIIMDSLQLSETAPSTKPLEACVSCEVTGILNTEGRECNAFIKETSIPEEKEEGEISDGESETDLEILEVARDRSRSPTVFLSSDSDKTESVDGRTDPKLKTKRNQHRNKQTSKNTDFMSTNHRRSKKRSHRNYRRKMSPLKVSSPTAKSDEVDIQTNRDSIPTKHPADGRKESAEESQAFSSSKVPSPETAVSLDAQSAVVTQSKEKRSVDSEERVMENESDSSINFVPLPEDPLNVSEEITEPESVSSQTSWADRWAEKKDLKKVVITSKICRNVRKKLLTARRNQLNQEASTTQAPPLPSVPPLVLHVEGSVQEYQMLQFLSDVCDEESCNGTNVEDKHSHNVEDTTAMSSATAAPSEVEINSDVAESQTGGEEESHTVP